MQSRYDDNDPSIPVGIIAPQQLGRGKLGSSPTKEGKKTGQASETDADQTLGRDTLKTARAEKTRGPTGSEAAVEEPDVSPVKTEAQDASEPGGVAAISATAGATRAGMGAGTGQRGRKRRRSRAGCIRKLWTAQEESQMADVVRSHLVGREDCAIDWATIAGKVGTGRSAASIKQRFFMMQHTLQPEHRLPKRPRGRPKGFRLKKSQAQEDSAGDDGDTSNVTSQQPVVASQEATSTTSSTTTEGSVDEVPPDAAAKAAAAQEEGGDGLAVDMNTVTVRGQWIPPPQPPPDGAAATANDAFSFLDDVPVGLPLQHGQPQQRLAAGAAENAFVELPPRPVDPPVAPLNCAVSWPTTTAHEPPEESKSALSADYPQLHQASHQMHGFAGAQQVEFIQEQEYI